MPRHVWPDDGWFQLQLLHVPQGSLQLLRERLQLGAGRGASGGAHQGGYVETYLGAWWQIGVVQAGAAEHQQGAAWVFPVLALGKEVTGIL